MRDNAHIVDLRSDTVTVPTPPMLQAMMAAEVGDDVYGEDRAVNRLQEMVAVMLGKEAALFVASGTMGNLVCIKSQTDPGDEIIMDADSHCYHYEGAGYAAIAGVGVHFVPATRGIMDPEQIALAVRPRDAHFPRSRLVVVENTHNRGGGSVYPVETVERIAGVCRNHGLALHMDGARLLNACVAAGVQPTDYTRHADSVTVCLSKGLGCPVGSVVAGSKEFVRRAHRVRKMLGGGMRQAGYLAAAGIYALEHNIERLAEDHANARLLADGIRGIQGLKLKYDPPETNMVYFGVQPPHSPAGLVQALQDANIRIGSIGGGTYRAVTHLGIEQADIERVTGVLRERYG
jgi:threonine aldolase